MTRTKYQIFISSTFTDLKDERDAVIKAILEMGHIPVGMEMFSAADEEQWKIIARQIDESDYYVVIVAHRYGSIVPVQNVSYTEKEYDYAVSQGVPVMGFVLEDGVSWPPEQIESDPKRKKGLEKFRSKVKSRPVSFWKNREELALKCVTALTKQFNTSPRPGWARADTVTGPEVTAELSRLSKENADLRAKVQELEQGADEVTANDIEWLESSITVLVDFDRFGKIIVEPDGRPIRLSLNLSSENISLSWKEIVLCLGDCLLTSPDISRAIDDLTSLFSDYARKKANDRGHFDSLPISNDDFERILSGLVLQGFMRPVKFVPPSGRVLEITSHGQKILQQAKTN